MCYNITRKGLYNTEGQTLKRPKPGFGNFIKTRIRHPFKFAEDMIVVDGSGQRFRDIGSAHTVTMITGFMLSVIMILCVFNWTAAGLWLVIFAAVSILFSHRFLRYFWTDFERVDEEGNAVEDKCLLYVKKRRKRPKAYNRLIKRTGEDEAPSEDIYCRYRWWQRILILLEAVLAFGVIIVIPAVGSGSPYSRLYTVELINPDLPFITETYSADGSVSVPDPDRGKIYLNNVDTMLEAYAEARAYIDTFCPEADIVDYAEVLIDGETTYRFTFKNFRRGLIYKKSYAIMCAEVNASEDWMKVYYWNYYAIESAFGPVKEPAEEIDTERIINIALKDTGFSKEDIEYYWIGAQSLIYAASDYDPGGDTWYAELHYKDRTYRLYTVNVTDGTAVREERY
jgi:hypothetical protein